MSRAIAAVTSLAVLPAMLVTLAGCRNDADCTKLTLRAYPALNGAPIRITAIGHDGKPLPNVALGFDLVTTPSGRALYDAGIRTDASGTATLDPAADNLGRFAGKAHYYRVFPSGNILGTSDQGYCSSAKSVAAFSYSDLAALPASFPGIVAYVATITPSLQRARLINPSSPDGLVRLCASLIHQVDQFRNSTASRAVADKRRLGSAGMALLTAATHDCSFEPAKAARDLKRAVAPLK